jgi:uncharacterized membrane protein
VNALFVITDISRKRDDLEMFDKKAYIKEYTQTPKYKNSKKEYDKKHYLKNRDIIAKHIKEYYLKNIEIKKNLISVF